MFQMAFFFVFLPPLFLLQPTFNFFNLLHNFEGFARRPLACLEHANFPLLSYAYSTHLVEFHPFNLHTEKLLRRIPSAYQGTGSENG